MRLSSLGHFSINLARTLRMPAFAGKLSARLYSFAVWTAIAAVIPHQATATGVRTLIFLLVIH
jgi:hypothetical protein